jgi:hypothetical protein
MYAGGGRSAYPRYGCCYQDGLPRRTGELSELEDAVDQRDLAKPRRGATEQTGASHRHVQKRTDDNRIELGSCARDKFSTSGLGSHRRLVRTNCGHRLIGVRDGHDPPTERDIVAGQTVGISLTVKSLMVLGDGVRPRTQPGGERCGEACAFQGMASQQLPLRIIGFSGLVQHRPWRPDKTDHALRVADRAGLQRCPG